MKIPMCADCGTRADVLGDGSESCFDHGMRLTYASSPFPVDEDLDAVLVAGPDFPFNYNER